jgi:hypothetical protein
MRSSPARVGNFQPENKTVLPVPRPAVASAIPADAVTGRPVGALLLLMAQDRLPDAELLTSHLADRRRCPKRPLAGALRLGSGLLQRAGIDLSEGLTDPNLISSADLHNRVVQHAPPTTAPA